MTGTSPRLPSAITSRPASRAAAQTSARAAQPGAPRRSKQASCGFTATQAGPGPLDQRAAVRRRPRRPASSAAGRPGSAGVGPVPGQLRRVGVEAEADLAAALLDERREPIREQASANQPPLTLVFRAEPAEKRGTLPPGIVIRSPVRGLTPWRGPRSATWNLPKPVKLDLVAGAQRIGDRVEHGVDRVARSFFAAQPVVACQLVQKLSLGHVEIPPRGLKIGAI